MSRVDASADRLDTIKTDLRIKERELSDLEKSVDLPAIREQVEKLKHDKQKLEASVKKLE